MTDANRKVTSFHNVAVVLLILILIGFWIYVNLGDTSNYYTIKYDPEFPYLLNSLSIFKGKPYAYIDHPGTPIELLGSAILFLTYPFIKLKDASFLMYHLTNPGTFLILSRGLLALLSIATFYLIAKKTIRIRNWRDSIFSIAIAGSFYAIHPPFAFETLVYWSHNSFAFPLGTLLLILLLVRLRSERSLHHWELGLLGVATGLLTAIQLWFAAWIIGASIAVFTFNYLQRRGVIQSLLSIASIIGGAVMGFIFATLPILHEYTRFFDWMKRLLMHQGKYGFGEPGFSSLSSLSDNLGLLWAETPLILIAASLAIAVIAFLFWKNYRNLHQNVGLWASAVGMTSQVIVSFVMILKHPGGNYLLAVAAVFPLLIAVIYLLEDQFPKKLRSFGVGLASLFIVGFIFSLTQSVTYHEDLLTNIHIVEDEIAQLRIKQSQILGKDAGDVNVLWSYGTGSKCLALRFGNVYTHDVFRDILKQLCPHDGLHDIFADEHDLGRIQKWDILIVPEYKFLKEYNELGEILDSDAQTLYGRIKYILIAPTP